MAGLVPAIHDFLPESKTWMPATLKGLGDWPALGTAVVVVVPAKAGTVRL
jgi:hypothetical protein